MALVAEPRERVPAKGLGPLFRELTLLEVASEDGDPAQFSQLGHELVVKLRIRHFARRCLLPSLVPVTAAHLHGRFLARCEPVWVRCSISRSSGARATHPRRHPAALCAGALKGSCREAETLLTL